MLASGFWWNADLLGGVSGGSAASASGASFPKPGGLVAKGKTHREVYFCRLLHSMQHTVQSLVSMTLSCYSCSFSSSVYFVTPLFCIL